MYYKEKSALLLHYRGPAFLVFGPKKGKTTKRRVKAKVL